MPPEVPRCLTALHLWDNRRRRDVISKFDSGRSRRCSPLNKPIWASASPFLPLLEALRLQEGDDQSRDFVVPHDVRVLLRHRDEVCFHLGIQVRQPRFIHRHRAVAWACVQQSGRG